MANHIVIYQDEGAGKFGISCLQRFFKEDLVRLVMAEEIISNSAFEPCDIFVMPGGADLPYCKKLNGVGNANIRKFVEQGGTYLGICAGAYYACSAIEYHKGRPDEICAPRELHLIDAVAVGSLPHLAPYYDETLQSAAIIPLTYGTENMGLALYHGGCTFSQNRNAEVVATYNDRNPAIIRQKIERGTVLLSGVHFECNGNDLLSYPCRNEDDISCALKLSQNLEQADANWHALLFNAGIQTQ